MAFACILYCKTSPACSRGMQLNPTKIFFCANRPNILHPGEGRLKQNAHASDTPDNSFSSPFPEYFLLTPTIYPLTNLPISKSASPEGNSGFDRVRPAINSFISGLTKIRLRRAPSGHDDSHSTNPASASLCRDRDVALDVNFLNPNGLAI